MIARGKFGIEYFPRPDDEESRGTGWLAAAIALAAVALLVVAGVRRLLSPADDMTALAQSVLALAAHNPHPDDMTAICVRVQTRTEEESRR